MLSINLTVPLYNEQTILIENVSKLLNFLNNHEIGQNYQWHLILADNGSTDKTPLIAQVLEKKYPKKIKGFGPLMSALTRKRKTSFFFSLTRLTINYLRLNKKGKGLAIKTAWQKFPADFYVFTDADLSTDLSALPHLIKELENSADIVIGSRYLPESQIRRSLLRLFVSKISLWFISKWLKLPLTDFTCGFKGVNQKIVQNILPLIKNQQWFFDTEMLCHTKRAGYTIKEIPVIWTETMNQKRKSKVGLIKVGWEYIKEVIKNRPA
ncbi:MAG: glycosyltransferase [Patescibacteria group bacterium]